VNVIDESGFKAVMYSSGLAAGSHDNEDQRRAARLVREFAARVMRGDVGDCPPALSFDSSARSGDPT